MARKKPASSSKSDSESEKSTRSRRTKKEFAGDRDEESSKDEDVEHRRTRTRSKRVPPHQNESRVKKSREVVKPKTEPEDEKNDGDVENGKARKMKMVSVKKEPDIIKEASKKKSAVKEEPPDEKEEDGPVMKSVVLKGKAPVDEHCPVAGKCHVFYDDEEVWDVMLNQTNIQNNNNKYYLIQILEEDGAKNLYYVWMRWGRVGYKGQNKLQAVAGDLDEAKRIFCQKFRDKTKNDWDNGRQNFEKVPGKYDLVMMDYSPGTDNVDSVEKKVKKDRVEIKPSRLHERIQDLLNLICNVRTMEETMIEMEYDTKKAPLGKITNEQIKAGYMALKRIADLIEKRDNISSAKSRSKSRREAATTGPGFSRGELLQACNEFYTRIPHEFGMQVPPLISTKEQVKRKIQLLEALGDIQVAMKILNNENDDDESTHPVDRTYKQLSIDMIYLEPESDDFRLIEKYIQSTHAPTHSMYSMAVTDIFECTKPSESERFAKDVGNRMLLFHGSRLSNWAGILGQGLRIAPPEAPSTGYMFGKGVYFADMSSKSANYCFTTPSKNVGILMLCEVACGVPNELLNANYDAGKLPQGKHSVKGLGKIAPDPRNFVKLKDGTIIPMGPGINSGVSNPRGYTLNYNEYIVYDTSQIRMRYLARITFNYKR